MTRSEELLSLLQSIKPSFKELGLKRVRVYGSVARGQANAESDVDLLVDFYKTPDLIKFVDIKHDLEDKLGCKVDMAMESALHPMLKDRILSEARDV